MDKRRPEPSLDDLLDDPILHAVLARDGLKVEEVRLFLNEMKERLRPTCRKAARLPAPLQGASSAFLRQPIWHQTLASDRTAGLDAGNVTGRWLGHAHAHDALSSRLHHIIDN